MAVNPEDLFDSAIRFRDKKEVGNEADNRSCISRAYYAGYHKATSFHDGLASSGKVKPDCGVHENLLHMLQKPTIPTTDADYARSIEIATYFKKILFNRRLADYQNDQPVSEKNVDMVFSETTLIFEEA